MKCLFFKQDCQISSQIHFFFFRQVLGCNDAVYVFFTVIGRLNKEIRQIGRPIKINMLEINVL